MATAARQERSAARNFPQTYSPGFKGVECSRSPTLYSASRIRGMPAATATKKDTMK